MIPATPPAGAGSATAAGNRDARKQRVLTQGIPSGTTTIADALVLKDRDLFLVTPPDGSMPCGREHGFGLYYHDCRCLHTYELQLEGMAPEALGAAAGAGRGSVQLTNPELRRRSGEFLPRDTVAIEWARELDGDALTVVDNLTLQ